MERASRDAGFQLPGYEMLALDVVCMLYVRISLGLAREFIFTRINAKISRLFDIYMRKCLSPNLLFWSQYF